MNREQKSQSFDIDELYSGFDSACFDSDLFENPYHPKLFAHLSVAELAVDEYLQQQFLSRKIYLEFFCVVGAVLLAVIVVQSLPQWRNIAAYKPRQAVFDIHLRPVTELQSVDTKLEETLETESQLIIPYPDRSLITIEEKEIEVLHEVQVIEVLKPTITLRDQIQDIVRDNVESDLTSSKYRATVEQGLTAQGVVFDSSLRETLVSDKIKHLNRWRPPESLQGSLAENGIDLDELEIDMMGVTISGESSQYSRIGDTCYKISFQDITSNTPGVPFVGNGWNISNYSKIDCDLLYLNDPIRREDVNKAGSPK